MVVGNEEAGWGEPTGRFWKCWERWVKNLLQ